MATLCMGSDCSVDLSQPKAKSIGCDFCKKWFCPECSNCPKGIFNAIQSANKSKDDVSMIMFICTYCRNVTEAIAKMNMNVNKLKDSIDSLKNSIENNGTEIKLHVDNKAAELTSDIKAEVTGQKLSFSDIVKKNQDNQTRNHNIEIKDVKRVVTESSLEIRDVEVGDRSFMMYLTKESKAEDGKQRKQDDIEFVNNFVKKGLCISSVSVEDCIRLGKYDSDKDDGRRPLKVTLSHRSDQVKVMRNLGNLKISNIELFKKCFVTIDRNLKQREEVKKLVEEAKAKNTGITDTKWVVRGTPYKPVLKEVEVHRRD